MTVTRERFAQGMTYDAYKEQMTRNRERFEANERSAVISAEDRSAFAGTPLHVLVITEDWCGDAVANFPLLGRLAKEAGTLDLRVFLRDQNDDLTAQYMNREFKSIPVFAFFDERFKELGRFIERPASVTELRRRKRAEIYASDPACGSADAPTDKLPEDVRARLSAALQKMRDDMKEFSDREVLRELRAIVTRRSG
jgi:hypothetical protein